MDGKGIWTEQDQRHWEEVTGYGGQCHTCYEPCNGIRCDFCANFDLSDFEKEAMNHYTLTADEAEALDSGDDRKVDQLRANLRERFAGELQDVEVTHPDGWVWLVIEGQA